MRKWLKIVALVFLVAVLVLAWPIWKRNQVRKAFDEAKRQSVDQVDALLESNPQLATADIGWTLLHWASGNGKVDLSNLLLEKGADVNAKDFHGHTPLHWTASGTTESSVGLLGLGLFPLTGWYRSTRAESPSRLLVVRLLVDHGADVNARDDEENTPLLWAALMGFTEVAEFFLAKGADVNAKDESDRTPLHWAASTGHKESVDLLLLNGADVNAKDKDGETPLQYADRRGHKGIVQLLRTAAASDNPMEQK